MHQGEEPSVLLVGDTFGSKRQKNLADVWRWIEEALLNPHKEDRRFCFIDVRVTSPALPAFVRRASSTKRKRTSFESKVSAIHLRWIGVYLNPDAALPYSIRDTNPDFLDGVSIIRRSWVIAINRRSSDCVPLLKPRATLNGMMLSSQKNLKEPY